MLTQYKSHSLDRHLITTWRLNTLLRNYVTAVPVQQRIGPHWQAGSADAIYQSLNLIEDEQPDVVAVFGADHVYRMDPRQMMEAHQAWGAGVTVAGIPVPRAQATGFGVAQPRRDGHHIETFREKPADPPGRPGQPDQAFASMGNYLFDRDVLVDALRKDAANEDSKHSVGGDIIPMLVRDGAAHVYDFLHNQVPGAAAQDAGYWQDLGTLDAYYRGQLDLCAADPPFQLDNERWPILTQIPVDGAARVDRSVLLHNTRVSCGAVVERAILDKNVVVPDGAAVGVDKQHDRARGFAVSEGGITVVGKGQLVTP